MKLTTPKFCHQIIWCHLFFQISHRMATEQFTDNIFSHLIATEIQWKILYIKKVGKIFNFVPNPKILVRAQRPSMGCRKHGLTHALGKTRWACSQENTIRHERHVPDHVVNWQPHCTSCNTPNPVYTETYLVVTVGQTISFSN